MKAFFFIQYSLFIIHYSFGAVSFHYSIQLQFGLSATIFACHAQTKHTTAKDIRYYPAALEQWDFYLAKGKQVYYNCQSLQGNFFNTNN